MGIGGGPLIVALIAGKLRRTGPLLWVMPLPANIVLRNFGLALFLATVGVNAGTPFVKTVSETGLLLLLIGVAVLLATVVIVLLVGYYLMKIPYENRGLQVAHENPKDREHDPDMVSLLPLANAPIPHWRIGHMRFSLRGSASKSRS